MYCSTRQDSHGSCDPADCDHAARDAGFSSTAAPYLARQAAWLASEYATASARNLAANRAAERH